MARNIVDIIQRILITGDAGVVRTFANITQAGVSAFGAIGRAAATVSAPFRKFEADLATVEKRAQTFGRSIAQVGSSVGSFAGRVTAATAGLAAAGGFALRGILSISTALKSVSAAVIEQRLAASQNAAQTKRDIQTDFQHANALEDLRHQWANNKISIEEYAESLRELRRTQARQLEQQRIMASEQEDIREQQAKDTAEAQKRALQIKLEAQYGGALAAVLQNLANVLDSVRQRFLGTFGPRIAEFLTNVVQGISNAAPAIFAVFDSIAKQIEATFSKSKLSTDGVIKAIIKFAQDAANIINTIVIPAFQGLVSILETIAGFINAVFGTNFTAGTLIAAAIVLKLTGLFGALFGVIKLVGAAISLFAAAFGPVGIAIAVVVGIIATQLIPWLMKLDWAGFAKKATDAWQTIKDAVGSVAGAIMAAWEGVKTFFRDTIASIIGFFDRLIAKVKEFLGLTGGTAAGSSLAAAAGANDIGAFARGGLFRGRPGKDTNLAWLTDKEFIINPKATKFWGPEFLHMINRMVNPIRGFADGGLNSLTPSMPRVAFAGSGGNSSGRRPMTLVIGDQEFDGLTVEDRTAESMGRYAQRRGVRSAGRRPMWFGGGR